MYIDHSTYAPPPSGFEPGTPPIAQAVGMGAAADYISSLGMHNIAAYEQEIGGYLYEKVSTVPATFSIACVNIMSVSAQAVAKASPHQAPL